MLKLANGVALSRLGLGTWQFSAGQGDLGKFWKALPQDKVTEIVRHAYEGGINWFDTAEKYGDGASERSLTFALKALGVAPGDVFIADKWWPKQRKASSLIDSIDERLACLNGYPIGLYQIHWPESESWLRTEMKYLSQLVDMGKVQNVGLCNYNWRQVKRAHRMLKNRGVKLDSIQVRYSLLHRSIESNNLLKLAHDLDLKVIAWSPLESGLLTGAFHADGQKLSEIAVSRKNMYGLTAERLKAAEPLIALLREIGLRHSASTAQVALAWTTQFHGSSVLAIPGASSVKQAEDNANASLLTLSGDDLQEIDQVSLEAAS